MGEIKDEVLSDHLAQFKNERPLVEPFCNGFEISWARERKAFNTSLSVYILTPDKYIGETFGFNSQLALFIGHFPSLQPRVFQAIEQILNEAPLHGRVDRNTFFLICKTDAEKKVVSDYVAEHSKSWIPIVLTPADLAISQKARWGIRHPIAAQIFTRDLFDQQLPLISDVDFFGREALLFNFKDAIDKGHNRGLFGLRKTGKTSLLFKITRSAQDNYNHIVLYYDCKKPRIRQQQYQSLLAMICDDISRALELSSQFRGKDPHERIELLANHVGKKRRICIIFDEIEYVSFLATMDPHWREDYINFWQTMWSLQSEYRNFCYFVSGVNPTVVEQELASAKDRLPKSLHFAESDVIIGVVRARSVHEVGYGHKWDWEA